MDEDDVRTIRGVLQGFIQQYQVELDNEVAHRAVLQSQRVHSERTSQTLQAKLDAYLSAYSALREESK